MDADTQSLIDQLRDRMAGMPPVSIYTLMQSLCDGYMQMSFDHNDKGFRLVIQDLP